MNDPSDRSLPRRLVLSALRRGMAGRCPQCGRGALFDGFLKIVDVCACRGEALHHHRADDAPPYFNMLIVGHVAVGLVLWSEIRYTLPLWVHAALWFPSSLLLAFGLMRPIKGAVVGLHWALLMHDFEPRSCGDDPPSGWTDCR